MSQDGPPLPVIQIGYLSNTLYWSACQIGIIVLMTGSCRLLRFTDVVVIVVVSVCCATLLVQTRSADSVVSGSLVTFITYESVYAWKIFRLILFILCAQPARTPFLCHVVELAYDAVALNSTGCSSLYLLLWPLLVRYVCWGTEILVPRRGTGLLRPCIKFHWFQFTVSSALTAAAKIRLLRHWNSCATSWNWPTTPLH